MSECVGGGRGNCCFLLFCCFAANKRVNSGEKLPVDLENGITMRALVSCRQTHGFTA